MAEVFISYKRNPSAILANLIKEKLERQHKIQTFLDDQDMPSGFFPDHLNTEINQAKALICILSNTTLKSKWVIQEIQTAYERGKTLIPVFHENYKLPSQDSQHPEHIDALLKSNGITILDKRGIYIEEAINKLVKLISPQHQIIEKDPQTQIEIVLKLPKINTDRFLAFIAGTTLIGINAITLISLHTGSIIITIELPKSAAKRLEMLTYEQHHLFSKYNLISFNTFAN